MDLKIKKKLFERMEYLNPDFKLNEDIGHNEQEIINDILSTNEDANNWWNKFVQYGKKGLLTVGIVLAVALSSQAQTSHKTDDVIKVGARMLSPEEANDLYNYMIGAGLVMSNYFKKNVDTENVNACSEIIAHYMNLRNGETPDELSPKANVLLKYFNDMYDTDKNDPQKLQKLINMGRNLKKFTYTY